MAKNTGKVREKSGNFVSPEKWEPCNYPAFAGNQNTNQLYLCCCQVPSDCIDSQP